MCKHEGRNIQRGLTKGGIIFFFLFPLTWLHAVCRAAAKLRQVEKSCFCFSLISPTPLVLF